MIRPLGAKEVNFGRFAQMLSGEMAILWSLNRQIGHARDLLGEQLDKRVKRRYKSSRLGYVRSVADPGAFALLITGFCPGS